MKLEQVLKLLLLPLLLFIFTPFSHAATLTDDFETNKGGWTSSGTSRVNFGNPINSRVLRMNKNDKWIEKEYEFGNSYANRPVTITFDLWAVGGWENSGGAVDYFFVGANGAKVVNGATIPGANGANVPRYVQYNLNATLDSEGILLLRIKQNVSAIGSEKAHLDNFSITATPNPIGCNNALDIPQNSYFPYTIVTSMHNITAATTSCISGSSHDHDGSLRKDFYYFTVGIAGTLTVSATSPNNRKYYFRIGDEPSGTEHYGQELEKTHSDTINLSANETVYFYILEKGNNDDHYEINFDFQPNSANAVNDAYNTAYNTAISGNVLNNDTGTGLQVLTGSITGPSNGTLSIQTNGSFTYTPTNFSGSDAFNYTIQDTNGNQSSATVTISVAAFPSANAIDDTYTMAINTVLNGNVITNDTGTGITVTTNTSPSDGALNILPAGGFTYTPTNGFFGSDGFTYTITDSNGGTSTADVIITISNDTNYTDGFVDFHIVNPPSSRNVNGNFAVAGNTVTCLTANTSGYGGACHGDNDYQFQTSNARVNKYIDIDSDGSTWNSTSSNITFPALSYEPTVLNGVIWAGLFWQGRIANGGVRYAQANGAGFSNTAVNASFTSANMQSTSSNQIKLKVDAGSYNDVQAIEQFNFSSSSGVTYAAYADVTSFLRNANMGHGEHTFTVANLTTGEGREGSPGLFGGWSLLVIYAENSIEGHLRNVSAYHGLQSLDNNPTIRISGFRLPSEGDVSSQATVFSGEGEHLYGRNTNSGSFDWMKISNDASNYVYLPGPTAGTHVGNRDNMFNAQFSPNIDRDAVGDNALQTNNNGVDIDLFDVSSIMEGYRNLDSDIDEVYLRGSSNNDYVTPSMIAFSTELFRPNVCYDFAIDRNGFALSTLQQDINTSALLGDEIGLTIAITSLESDFDLQNSAVSVNLNQTVGHIALDQSRAFYSPVNSNVLLDTPFTALSTPIRPEIAIGSNRNPAIGGLIGAFEQYFSKVYFDVTDVNASRIYSTFDVELTTAIDFGSGPVTQILPVPRCPQSLTYNPKWLAFNVERHTVVNPTISNNTDRYSLYTQIAGQDFDYSVVSYDPVGDYTAESVTNGITVDVELINADSFDDNGSALKCANPDPTIIHGGFGNSQFVTFNNASRVPVVNASDFSTTGASRSNVFRTWILVDQNDTIIPHTSARNEGNDFRTIYQNNYENIDTSDRCDNACITNGVSNSTECYDCLRLNFAKAICSRDNFSIRPASYRLTLSDAGSDGNQPVPIDVIDNTASPANTNTFAAEYNYHLNGFATNSSGTLVGGYTRINSQFTTGTLANNAPELTDNTLDLALMQFQGNTTNCNDTNHQTHDLNFDAGTLVEYNLSSVNVGRYDFSIKDNGWTVVDQAAGNPFKTVFSGACTNSALPECNDCGIGSGALAGNPDGKYGCSTLSDLDDAIYEELQLTFNPYQFDLNTSLTFIRRPTTSANSNIVYFNDLNNDPNFAMSIGFNGFFTAEGFLGNTMTNFVDGCAAQNIQLDTNKTSSPGSVADNLDVNITFQQVLVDSFGTSSGVVLDNNPTALSASNFPQGNNGQTGNFDIHYNYAKSANPMNPVDVNITLLTASSPNASSNANMLASYVPDGNVTGGQNRFYYTRVIAGQATYTTTANFQNTGIFVQIYCSDGGTLCTDMGLNTVNYPNYPQNTQWYSANIHDANDGVLTGLSVTTGSATILPNVVPMPFIGGSIGNLNVLYNGAVRPETNVINAIFSPWLSAPLNYNVIFSSNGNWAGVGSTGNVVGTLPQDQSNNRVSW